MLDQYQRYVVRQAANVLKAGKYQWEKGRVAYDMLGRPCEIDSPQAGYFDIFGIIDRVNSDLGFVTLKITPIFEEMKKAIVAGSIGDTTVADLQRWNDSPSTTYADVLRVLDIVGQGANSSTGRASRYTEAAE